MVEGSRDVSAFLEAIRNRKPEDLQPEADIVVPDPSEYPDVDEQYRFKVRITPLSPEKFRKILRKTSQRKKGIEYSTDDVKTNMWIARNVVKGWSGLTVRKWRYFIPASKDAKPEFDGFDPDEEVPYSPELFAYLNRFAVGLGIGASVVNRATEASTFSDSDDDEVSLEEEVENLSDSPNGS